MLMVILMHKQDCPFYNSENFKIIYIYFSLKKLNYLILTLGMVLLLNEKKSETISISSNFFYSFKRLYIFLYISFNINQP